MKTHTHTATNRFASLLSKHIPNFPRVKNSKPSIPSEWIHKRQVKTFNPQKKATKMKLSPFSFSIFIIILVWYHSRLLFVSSIRILFSFILFYFNSRINYCIWFLDCVILLWSAFEHCMEFALYKLLLLSTPLQWPTPWLYPCDDKRERFVSWGPWMWNSLDSFDCKWCCK